MKPNEIVREENPLFLALALWVCTAPFIFLIAVQITGAAIGGLTVAALLAAYLVACFVTHRMLARQVGRGASDAT
jgi:hypothetical protein